MAQWYYAQNKQRMGPVEEAEFQGLVNGGTITPNTLVWTQGMANWQRYAEVAPKVQTQSAVQQAGPAAAAGGAMQAASAGATPQAQGQWNYPCVECGRMFPAGEMVRYGQHMVCPTCKPVFFQRLREGVGIAGQYSYGGFWIRFLAKFIDGIIMNIATYIIQIPIMLAMGAMSSGSEPNNAMIALLTMVNLVVSIGIPLGYTTFFLGKYAATPGKMACGLKVIRSNGEPVTYMRAFGRHWAEMLSGLILGIGYLMAAFDDEKRTLHDRIVDTRVIKT